MKNEAKFTFNIIFIIFIICLLSKIVCNQNDMFFIILRDLSVPTRTCLSQMSIIYNDQNAQNDFKNCVTYFKNFKNHLEDESAESYCKRFCGNENVTWCQDVSAKYFESCLSESQKIHLKSHKLAQKAILELTCENNGKIVKESANWNFSFCFMSNDQCSLSFSAPPETGDFTEGFYTEEGCRKRENYERCIANKYKDCNNKPVYEFYLEQNYRALRATPCKQYMSDFEIYEIMDDLRIDIKNKTCVEHIRDKVRIERLIAEFKDCERHQTGQNWNKYFKKYCGKNDTKWCHDVVINNFDVCLTDSQKNHLKYIQNEQHIFLYLTCYDDGKILREFYNANWTVTTNCSSTKETEEERCGDLTLVNAYSKLVDLYSNECQNRKDRYNCVANTYKKCENEEMYQYFKRYGQQVLKSPPCNKDCTISSPYSLSLVLILVTLICQQL